jgi:hypothetical protein
MARLAFHCTVRFIWQAVALATGSLGERPGVGAGALDGVAWGPGAPST